MNTLRTPLYEVTVTMAPKSGIADRNFLIRTTLGKFDARKVGAGHLGILNLNSDATIGYTLNGVEAFVNAEVVNE